MANKRGWWKLEIINSEDDNHIELSDADREHIGKCVSEGYHEGEIVKDDE